MEFTVSLSSSYQIARNSDRLLFSLSAWQGQILCSFSTQQYMLSALYAIACPSICLPVRHMVD